LVRYLEHDDLSSPVLESMARAFWFHGGVLQDETMDLEYRNK
jgi:hypothetical protein